MFADHIQTPRVITRATDNKIVWRWDNADPFGLLQPSENPSGLGLFVYNPRMPGQIYDKETNLFHNGFRDYDSQLGRYVQSDPVGLAGGINTYTYVNGNPVSYIDPDGTIGVLGVFGTIATGYVTYSTWNAAADAAKSMDKRPGGDDVLRDPSLAGAALKGQKDAIVDLGKVGGSGAKLGYKSPLMSAEDFWNIGKNFCKTHF